MTVEARVIVTIPRRDEAPGYVAAILVNGVEHAALSPRFLRMGSVERFRPDGERWVLVEDAPCS